MMRGPAVPGASGFCEYLPTLDGWRAIAIAMVLFCHVRLPGSALSDLAPYGAVGVHLFFAISGFLITNRLLEEAHKDGCVSLRAFYIRRAFRILPAAMAYLAALAVLSFFVGAIRLDWGQLAASAFFYRNYFVEPAVQSWYTGHYWSLSVEEHFYLLWPGLLVLIGLGRARWVAPLLAVAFAGWRALDTQFAWIASVDPALRNLVERTDYRLDGLLWGCAAAFLWDHRPSREWLAKRRFAAVYVGGAVALATLCLIAKPSGFEAMFALFMPVPLLLTSANPNGWLGRALEARAMRWFGRLSYSVYVWQTLFLPLYGLPQPLGFAQQLPVNLMLILGCAAASYYLVERPMRRFGRGFSERRAEVAVGTAA